MFTCTVNLFKKGWRYVTNILSQDICNEFYSQRYYKLQIAKSSEQSSQKFSPVLISGKTTAPPKKNPKNVSVRHFLK